MIGFSRFPNVPDDGKVFSFGEQMVAQLIGAGSIILWVGVASAITWFIIKAIVGIRVSEEEEYEGVDIAECGMEAYPEFTGKI